MLGTGWRGLFSELSEPGYFGQETISISPVRDSHLSLTYLNGEVVQLVPSEGQ
jgi:hypothetical protein